MNRCRGKTQRRVGPRDMQRSIDILNIGALGPIDAVQSSPERIRHDGQIRNIAIGSGIGTYAVRSSGGQKKPVAESHRSGEQQGIHDVKHSAESR
jgi:hypothetical protein